MARILLCSPFESQALAIEERSVRREADGRRGAWSGTRPCECIELTRQHLRQTRARLGGPTSDQMTDAEHRDVSRRRRQGRILEMTKLEAERMAAGGVVIRLERTTSTRGGSQVMQRVTTLAPCWARDDAQRAEWQGRLDELHAAGFRHAVERKA